MNILKKKTLPLAFTVNQQKSQILIDEDQVIRANILKKWPEKRFFFCLSF